ncbi:hypothetical protein PV05_07709 [Exophiala xenobiotica]|uniref:Uncharacterized protein n=1 Tax=Exophiala xenobiotica TaxID=348802 RepID=A0A0D2BIC2_9EURO|nr:uncharacterized protein PV05_07709 [Exophiala xenobiotica]KIW52036.1 hypothetical protein PV05_07709 [Exophiala xenobiotica]
MADRDRGRNGREGSRETSGLKGSRCCFSNSCCFAISLAVWESSHFPRLKHFNFIPPHLLAPNTSATLLCSISQQLPRQLVRPAICGNDPSCGGCPDVDNAAMSNAPNINVPIYLPAKQP